VGLGRVKITSLEARGYRNLEGSYGLPAPLAVIVGENNAGKSNVIDALRTVIEPDNPARGRAWLHEDDFAHAGDGARLGDELELGIRLEGLVLSDTPFEHQRSRRRHSR
jgi:putative ATP-dependent endonuclease of the OLD family